MQSGLEKMVSKCLHCKIIFKKRVTKQKFCSLTCSSRFNLNGLRKVKLPRKSNRLAEFTGICLGDGNTYKYQVTVSLNSIADKEYQTYVISLAKNLFPDVSISIVKRKFNMIDIKLSSRIVADFMKNMGIVSNNKTVPDWIKTKLIFRKYCVKGLVDTEGSVSFKSYMSRKGIVLYKQLNFRNYNPELMKFVRDVLLELELNPSLLPKKSLYLSTSDNITKYKKIIGFGNPKLLKLSSISSVKELKRIKHRRREAFPINNL